MRSVLLCVLLLGCLSVFAQEKYTISGYTRDAADGEELIGVTVFVKEVNGGAISNSYGFYSVTLPPGEYTLVFSYMGYQSVTANITLKGNISLNPELEIKPQVLEGVVVTSEVEDQNITAIQMSRNEINIQQMKLLPSLFGEPDIIKSVQMQPGVASVGEGTSGYYVRGGTPDQNLILIDEAPVYDPSHLFGLFSVFNADVIKDADLIKGGIPAQYGGRLSSILDVRTKDGNTKRFSGAASIGTMAAKLTLEGPIKKDASSWLISGRRSYIDLFLKGQDDINQIYFYDVNAKINWRKNNNNRFFVAAYLGRDVQKFNDDGGFDWGNTTGTFRWNHVFSDRLFSNTSLIFSNFDYGLEIYDEVEGLDWTANLQQAAFKQDMTFFLSPKNQLSFGYHLTYHRFSPGRIKPNDPNSIFKDTELQKMFALDHALYVGNEQQVSKRIALNYGLRLSIFQNVGESTIYTYRDPRDNVSIERIDSTHYGHLENIKTFVNLEPRFAARYMLNKQSSLKLSYNRMVQNVHLISNSVVALPFNTWAPSSPYLDPQLSDQVALGYFRNWRNNAIEFSAEVFYKDFQNLTRFADNANIFFNEDLATEFRTGDGQAYGLEMAVRKNVGSFKGFLSYTLSKAEETISTVNNDLTYPSSHDRRHNLSLVATYEFNDKWTIGGNFIYSTGRPFTLPVGRYEIDNYNLDYYTGRNQYRLPDFHRLDLSATLNSRKNVGRRWKSLWTFAIYNVYNRKNTFTIYTRKKQDEEGNIIGDGSEKEARMVYLFPVLPSVSYTIKF